MPSIVERVRCDKEGCSRYPVFGSRCALHWMRRQEAWRRMPHYLRGWKEVERILALSIATRVMVGIEHAGEPISPLPKKWKKYDELALDLIRAADRRAKKDAATVRFP